MHGKTPNQEGASSRLNWTNFLHTALQKAKLNIESNELFFFNYGSKSVWKNRSFWIWHQRVVSGLRPYANTRPTSPNKPTNYIGKILRNVQQLGKEKSWNLCIFNVMSKIAFFFKSNVCYTNRFELMFWITNVSFTLLWTQSLPQNAIRHESCSKNSYILASATQDLT